MITMIIELITLITRIYDADKAKIAGWVELTPLLEAHPPVKIQCLKLGANKGIKTAYRFLSYLLREHGQASSYNVHEGQYT